jgi:N-acetylglucosamine-binding protein A
MKHISILGFLFFVVACRNEGSTSSVAGIEETQCKASLALTQSSQTHYEFVFPEGLAAYEAGTRVLQLKTGNIYECKGFPYTDYCRDWTSVSTRFEPGTGSNWMAAWDLK